MSQSRRLTESQQKPHEPRAGISQEATKTPAATVNADDFIARDGFNFGLYHGASGTLALDLDDLEQASELFENVADTDLTAWLKNPERVKIKSPKTNRAKLIFKLPDGFEGAGLRQLKHNGKVIFELRSGNCQDVIYGQHPEGGDYQLIGNPAAIPIIPDVLLDMLQHWDDWKLCFDSALGINQEPPKQAPRRPQQGEHLAGWVTLSKNLTNLIMWLMC